MPHDKIKSAARARAAETGEPYAAARRAVLAGHQAPPGQGAGGEPPPDGGAVTGPQPPRAKGCVLAMSGEIRHWLTGLHRSDPPAALRVVTALGTLLEEGPGRGEPLVTSPAGDWPGALLQALDQSYQEQLAQLAEVRRGEADAATLIGDIQEQVTVLQAIQAELEERYRRAPGAGQPPGTASLAGEPAAVRQQIAAVRQQLAEATQLLPGVIQARSRLGQASQRLQARVDAHRTRKESLKASYVAAASSRHAHEVLTALDSSGDADGTGTAGAPSARLADLAAQLERELGCSGCPEGLLELRPGAPLRDDIRILFAIEPPGTALLIAVLDGLGAVADQFPEALLAAADRLQHWRAGQAPEAAAHTYPDPQSLLGEFCPGADR